MDDAATVGIRHRLATAGDDLHGFGVWRIAFQPTRDRLSFDELKRHEPDIAVAVEIEYARDTRVRQTLHLPKFTSHAHQSMRIVAQCRT
jgi:hypothetical protein